MNAKALRNKTHPTATPAFNAALFRAVIKHFRRDLVANQQALAARRALQGTALDSLMTSAEPCVSYALL